MRRSLKYDIIIGAEVLLEYVMLAIVEFTQGTLRIIDFCYLRVLPLVQHAKPLFFSIANAAVGTARVLQFLSAQARLVAKNCRKVIFVNMLWSEKFSTSD